MGQPSGGAGRFDAALGGALPERRPLELHDACGEHRAFIEEYTALKPAQVRSIACLKLALVGLSGFEDYYPSEISGGMRKRAALARAMALDPEILFLDEPSAGLDPISASLLDQLILELQDSLGTTVVVVTHELASIFAIGTNSVFLDGEEKTMIAAGPPRRLLAECSHPTVGAASSQGVDRSGWISRPCLMMLTKRCARGKDGAI